MKKYLAVALAVFVLVGTAKQVDASVAYRQQVNLSPGWSLVSTPKVLDSYTFSADENSSNFDIYVLNASSTSGWSTMADLNQTTFTPLFGYFIDNKTDTDQTLTFNYAADVAPADRFFNRSFGKTGWYSIGVANPTFAKSILSNDSDSDNPSSILYSLSGSYDTLVDLTDVVTSTAVSDSWTLAIPSTANTLNDFRETKAYATYITQTDSHYDGFENNSIPDSASSTLTLTANQAPLRSQNYRVDSSGDSLQGVPMLTFNLKSELNDSTLLTVSASTTASGTPPSTLYLYQGSTLLQSKSYNSNGVVFDNLDQVLGSSISINTTQTYTIKADFPTNTVNGSFASTTVRSVTFKMVNGNNGIASGSSVSGVNQYVYSAAPLFALASTPTISITGTNQFGSSTAMTASFSFNVTAQGGTMTEPLNTDFVVKFATSTLGDQLTASAVVVTVPNNNIADGSTATVNVTAQIANSSVAISGMYGAYVSSIRWTVGANTITQTYGLDDYKTSSAANFIK